MYASPATTILLKKATVNYNVIILKLETIRNTIRIKKINR